MKWNDDKIANLYIFLFVLEESKQKRPTIQHFANNSHLTPFIYRFPLFPPVIFLHYMLRGLSSYVFTMTENVLHSNIVILI